MTQEKKQEFTRRLSCCNRGGMVVIMYDILFAYLEDAKASHSEDYAAFKGSVGKAQQVLRRLMDDLDFTYPVAGSLYGAYQFANKHLALAICKNEVQNVQDAQRVLKNLYEGFVEAARQDTSEPLMQHTQQVVAGMTYHKGSLTETLQGSENSRGFLA